MGEPVGYEAPCNDAPGEGCIWGTCCLECGDDYCARCYRSRRWGLGLYEESPEYKAVHAPHP